MTIKNKPIDSEITIDLTGPDGNAFVLMRYATSFSKQLGNSPEETKKIIDEMKEGDYENLVSTFDAYFGSFVTLYR